MQPAPSDLTLFTAGYQGHNIETFLDLLMAHGVEQLIDVRQLPFSRKPDFSKKRLTAHLDSVGSPTHTSSRLAHPSRCATRCAARTISRPSSPLCRRSSMRSPRRYSRPWS